MKTRTFSESFERMLSRLVDGTATVARDAVVAGLLIPVAQGTLGCAPTPAGAPPPADPRLGAKTAALSDWVHDEGVRDTNMVQYMGSWWTQYTDCGSRGGCQGVDVIVKLRVRWVEGANLDQKKIGVYCAAPFCLATGQTAMGHYFGGLPDGWEEWHVPVNRRMWDTGAISFTAWYQDGKGHTLYDDNEGALHPIAYRGEPVVLRHDWTETEVTVGDDGVKGRITVLVADLAYEKVMKLVWTTDAWATVNEAGMGEGPNLWHWKDDVGGGFDRWEIQLDLPGPAERFEYAVLFRHGPAAPAKAYDFWDSNGGMNHVVVNGAYVLPFTP